MAHREAWHGGESMQSATEGTLYVPSLVDALYAAVRDRILIGQIPGGTPLTEMEIAVQYSVARPTAKAAMSRLVHEGLLRRSTNKTARVPILDVSDVRDLYSTRGYLEREVVGALAARRLVPEPARRSVQALRDQVENPELAGIVEADIAFHRALVDALGSPRLSRLYGSLLGEAHLCMAQVQAHKLLAPSRIVDEHSGILDAIQKGNETLVVKRITAHLDRACSRLVGYLGDSAEKTNTGKPKPR
jgi:DNA-binding GntR family transcriptional regulator